MNGVPDSLFYFLQLPGISDRLMIMSQHTFMSRLMSLMIMSCAHAMSHVHVGDGAGSGLEGPRPGGSGGGVGGEGGTLGTCATAAHAPFTLLSARRSHHCASPWGRHRRLGVH